ncbi:hypothetical protein PUR71_06030 [Streptomyces sp. SP17BM10]|uniref:hypothetical protein n=1 Tax=Streptomyces sp. SP17BM10 TaxID=3002530 RepID=UPI002E7A951E|nr:hypothetical protein [Streptomyces sp. SP17BM10]MEE1782481.1 hypothetical protein [Streptomyces sp. SP17BM10]
MRSNPRTRQAVLLAASGLAVTALVAGCGSSGSGSSAKPSPSTTPAPTLQTATDPKLGTIVTDGSGFTLYRFDKDESTPPDSYCNAGCVSTWPPEAATGNATVKGIDSKLVGSFTRDDGSKQITINGWPVYRYAPDTKPGDTKGQGVMGVWFAVTPTGGKAGAPSGSTPAPSAPATPKPSAPSSGY